MSSIWLFFLLLIAGAIGVVYYVISQMKETEKLDQNAPHIVPGNLQVSKPTQKPPQRSLPPEIPKPTLSSLNDPDNPDPKDTPVDFLPPKDPNRRPPKPRFFKDKQDIRRSFIIDELLNRKTK